MTIILIIYSKSMTNNIFFTINHNFHFTYIKYLAIFHKTGNSVFSFRAFKVIYKGYRNSNIFREDFENCLKLGVKGCVLQIITHLGQYFIRLYEPAQAIKAILAVTWHHAMFWESCVNEIQSQFLGLVIFWFIIREIETVSCPKPLCQEFDDLHKQAQQIPMMSIPWAVFRDSSSWLGLLRNISTKWGKGGRWGATLPPLFTK